MNTFCVLNYYRKFIRHVSYRKYCSASKFKDKNSIEKIRNIGILAHIDAGKTTTTERMLFYSGTIRSMGEVHHGNTVTDYMEQERQRGITITSAAVSFPWKDHQINLIDTPGHIDFTMEVEQSLAVLDGAVVVLDASAGVEAQTLTVWRQADGHRVPRILYLNKMDRTDSDVSICLNSIRDKLGVEPLLLHLPIRQEDKLIGLVDLVTLEEIIWTQGRGQHYNRRKLTEKDGQKWEKSMSLHRELIDNLSSMDDQLTEAIIQQESLENIENKLVEEALRRSTLDMKAFPILCGSSYKNIGVQTLMDAVTTYLPSPLDCNTAYQCFESDLSARAFKVQHDDQRGVLTFLRLYSGEITKGQKIYNVARDKNEQTGYLYVALADEYKPVEKVTRGNIAVVSSLKSTMTGDLVTTSAAAATRARTALTAQLRQPARADALLTPAARHKLPLDADHTPEDIADVLLGIGTTIPEPVFFCSVEPPSAGQAQALESALAELAREDPSLRVDADHETGQLLLAGMGELHLEVIKERIVREYGIEVELGPPQISYREALVGGARVAHAVDRKVGGARQLVNLTMSAKHVKGVPQDKVLRLDKSAESASNLSHAHPRYLTAVRAGLNAALRHGPRLGCPLVDVQVTLHWLEVGRGTADSAVSAAAAHCLRKVFGEAGSVLLEPVMRLALVVPESHAARVMADLARRRADLRDVQLRHGNKVVECVAPLSELVGYSSALRTLSSGLATFTMELLTYREVPPQYEHQAVTNITGF